MTDRDLTTSTPREIDTELAPLWARERALLDRLTWRRRELADARAELTTGKIPTDRFGRRRAATPAATLGQRIRDLVVVIADLEPEAAALRAEVAPLEAEYARRPWRRYFLVTNQNGHVHRGMDCATCFASTTYSWLVELAGCDERELVAAYGEKACTVCFPDAPTLPGFGDGSSRAAKLDAEAKAAKAAEKAAKQAAKSAKAILAPNGATLYSRSHGPVRTLVTARNVAVENLVDALAFEKGIYHNADAARERAADAEMLIAAIAHKTGFDPGDVRAELVAKAAAKFRREYK